MAELRPLLKGVKWSYFQGHDGVAKINGIRFACGVGIYLKRYVAAVATHAQWLALKPITDEKVIAHLDDINERGWGLAALVIGNRPQVIRPTTLSRHGIDISVIDGTEMWDELIIPNDDV
jgi:hypothetical protein